MMSPLTNVVVPASPKNYTKGRTSKITEICIHHMAGVMTAQACGKLWQNPKRKGSSNYGIGYKGEIGNYVDESNTAWCNSNWASNCRSISIETSNDKTGGDWHVSDASLDSLIKLVADIARRYKFGTLVRGKNITWHSMYASTACPGPYLLSKINYIIDKANEINSDTPSSFLPARGYIKLGDKSENISKLATFMRKTFPSYTSAKALGPVYGPNLMASIKEFQRRCKAEGLYDDNVDGLVGKKTLACLEHFGFKY